MPRLNGLLLSASTYYNVYSAPTQSRATVTVSFCNISDQPAFIRLALVNSGSGSPTLQDFVEYNAQLPSGASLERTGLTPYNSQSLFAYSNISNVSVVVWGYTE
jgi:hypothetical protein